MDRYFTLNEDKRTKIELIIKNRNLRPNILGRSDLVHIKTGDILVVVFWKEAIVYRFEGICFASRKKSLICPETSLALRNVIMRVGIEMTVSYYYNRVYYLIISDYKRKQFLYKKSKLFFIRKKVNRASRVK